MDKILIFLIKFKNADDLIVEASVYKKYKNFLEFCKEYGIDIKERVRSYYELIDIIDFPQREWNG